jgi:O-antigen/teichoic acid export membrane protein
VNYKQKVITGFSSESIFNLSTYFLTLVKTYILARILEPSDFGLFSLTVIALGVSEAMTQTGINLTIIQSKRSVEYFLDTAWVIAIGRGFFIGVLMIVLGFGISAFYQLPSLLILIAIAALIPVIKGFINPYIVVLHKHMMYVHDVTFRFVIHSVTIIASILLGIWLHNVYALVLGMLISAIVEVFLSFLIFQKKPIFRYIPSRAKLIFDNAKWLSIGSLLNYLVEHLDDFLIGAITNIHLLGFYHNAYGLTHKANYEISKSVHYSTIPVYTKLIDKKERLKKAFLKSFFYSLLIMLAISIPIYVFNQQIITILLGEKWLETIPLVRPLIIAGIIQGISMICYTLMLTTKHYKIMNLHLFISAILMALFISVLGSSQGLLGAVNGILYSRIIAFPIVAWAIYHFFHSDQADCKKPL